MTKELIILDDDLRWLEARIKELEININDLGPDFYDALNQSSETWHDNAPFDALRDKQSVLFAELTQLRKLRLQRSLQKPSPTRDTANIGATVILDQHIIFIAGDWTYRSGKKYGDALVVSAASPIALAVIGKKVGETTDFGTIKAVQW